jgi:hypothetical protein
MDKKMIARELVKVARDLVAVRNKIYWSVLGYGMLIHIQGESEDDAWSTWMKIYKKLKSKRIAKFKSRPKWEKGELVAHWEWKGKSGAFWDDFEEMVSLVESMGAKER